MILDIYLKHKALRYRMFVHLALVSIF